MSHRIIVARHAAAGNEREWEAVNKAVNKGAPAVSKHHGSEMFR